MAFPGLVGQVAAGNHPILHRTRLSSARNAGGGRSVATHLARECRTPMPDPMHPHRSRHGSDGRVFDHGREPIVRSARHLRNGSAVSSRLTIDLADLDVPPCHSDRAAPSKAQRCDCFRAGQSVFHRRSTSPTRPFGDCSLACGPATSQVDLDRSTLGRGQHFTGFMALTDHDPSLVSHRVWTTEKDNRRTAWRNRTSRGGRLAVQFA